MSRQVDFSKRLNKDDLAYVRDRPWLAPQGFDLPDADAELAVDPAEEVQLEQARQALEAKKQAEKEAAKR